MQASNTASLFGQPAQQAAPSDSSSTFSWLDAFQARQDALRAQAAGVALLLCVALSCVGGFCHAHCVQRLSCLGPAVGAPRRQRLHDWPL